MNIVLVGPGGMGTVHYQNYKHIPDAHVTAVVGTTEADQKKAAAWNLPFYPSIADACQKAEAELVDLCVPTYMHTRLALEAFTLGKHVITEKPAALSIRDARTMFDAARKANVQLYVAQVLQFTRDVEILHEALKDSRYGQPLDASFERLTACPKWSVGNWLLDERKSGLVPFDIHIHDLDLIVSLFGKPHNVTFTACSSADKSYHEQYRFTYSYDTLNVNAEAAWFNACIPFTSRWRIYFERGMLIRDEHGLNGYDAEGNHTVYDIKEPIKIPTGINLPPTGMFLTELSHFIARAKDNLPSERVPEQQVLTVLEVLESVTKSSC